MRRPLTGYRDAPMGFSVNNDAPNSSRNVFREDVRLLPFFLGANKKDLFIDDCIAGHIPT